jgi:hypothetical protein
MLHISSKNSSLEAVYVKFTFNTMILYELNPMKDAKGIINSTSNYKSTIRDNNTGG